MKWLTTCTASIAIAIAVWPAMACAWNERPIAAGGLHGTIARLDGANPAVVVLILAGSGRVDRNGNLPGVRNDSLKLLAHGLAERGFASLRIDKRGVAGSAGAATREEDLRIDGYADDVVAWVEVLRAEPNVSRIVLLGHSEGALIATLAAQRTDVAALILLAGAGEPAGGIIARQLSAAGVPRALRESSKQISDSLLQGKLVANVPPELAALYRPSVQHYLMSWLSRDPAAELARIAQPVLIVQGTTDLQVLVSDAHRLAAARPKAKLVIIEGMNHVLKDAPAERDANLQTYAMPDVPLAPALLPAIADFIRKM